MENLSRRGFAAAAVIGAAFVPSIALAAPARNVRSVAILADVAAVTIGVGDCLYVEGRIALGDGFEGMFVARAKLTGETPDQVLTLASTADPTLLWERQISNQTYLSSWWVTDRSVAGPACNQALNAMFAAIPASDCTVVFSEGVYKLGDVAGWQPVTMDSKTRVAVLAGGQAIITTSGLVPADAIPAFAKAIMIVRNCRACRIEGLVFDAAAGGASGAAVGGFSVVGSSYCQLVGLEGCAFGNIAIFSEVACEGSSWEDCYAHDSVNAARGFWLGHTQSAAGIGSYLSRDIKVHRCRAISNDATGFGIIADGASIVGNTSSDNNGSGIASPTLNGYTVRRHAIVGNICQGNSFYGFQTDVYATDPAYYLVELTLASNLFNGNVAGGALIDKCRDGLVTGNVCSRSGVGSGSAYGIQVEGTSSNICVVGNSCLDDRTPPLQTAGIVIYARTGVVITNVSVSSNTCSGNGTGIDAQGINSGATISGLNLSGNLVRANNNGILLALAPGAAFSNIVVSGNNCRGNSNVDLRCTVTGAKLRGNTYDTFIFAAGVPYPVHDTDAAAGAGGLKRGEEYQTAAGELRVKL